MTEFDVLGEMLKMGPVGVVIVGLYIFHRKNPPKTNHDNKSLQILDKLAYIVGDTKATVAKIQDDCAQTREMARRTHERVGKHEVYLGEITKEIQMNGRTLDKIHERLDRILKS